MRTLPNGRARPGEGAPWAGLRGAASGGARQIPLSQLAEIRVESGPALAEAEAEQEAFSRAWVAMESVGVPHARVAGPRPDVAAVLTRSGLTLHLGAENITPGVREAVALCCRKYLKEQEVCPVA